MRKIWARMPIGRRPGAETAITWLSAFGLLAVVVLFSLILVNDRRALAEKTEDLTQVQALLLSEHAARLFDAANLALSTLVDDTRGIEPDALAGSERLYRRFNRLAEFLPYVESFWFNGPDGRLRLSSLAFPAPALDASDMAFFIAHRDNPDSGVHVSDTIIGRTDRPTFRLSRRVEDERGNFRGVASLTAEVSFFSNFYGQLSLPAGSTVTLMRAGDLSPLIRHPPLNQGQPLLNRERLRAEIEPGAEMGLFRDITAETSESRIFAYRRVPGFPMIVKVSIPMAGMRDQWIEQLRLRLAEAALTLAALGALTWLGLKQAGRQRLFQQELEQRVTARTAELEHAYSELETLVQEVHHRVRNNLQMIGSLLNLEAGGRDPEISRILAPSIGRVHTIGLVYQALYEAGAVVELPFADYLRRLARDVTDIHPGPVPEIRIHGENPALPLDIAVPLALMVHEVLSNAIRHAFADGRTREVDITLVRTDGEWRLSIADNGRGLPPGFDWTRRQTGLGFRLVRSLAAQIGGEIEIVTDRGARFSVRWPVNYSASG